MKMKKLLAGVLSAAMVATMIPAGMAFSVSAAPEDSLVESYDLTTDIGREGWVAGGAAANIATDENGVTFSNGYVEQNQSYSITNPLNGKAAEGFSVALTVTVPAGAYVNAYESMFNFNGTAAQTNAVFNISGNGGGAHYNDWAANYWDITSGAAVDLSQGSIFVLTVDAEDNITLYSNGEVVNTFNSSSVSHTGTPGTVADLVNGMSNFSLGAAPAVWGQPAMTVSAVSFYSSALSAQDVASLGTYTASSEIGSGLISGYEFNGDLENMVEGRAVAVTEMNTADSGTQAASVVYTSDSTAISLRDSACGDYTGYDYGLKLDVPMSEIMDNVFTVSFNTTYAYASRFSSSVFAVQDGYKWYSIGQGDRTDDDFTGIGPKIWMNSGDGANNYSHLEASNSGITLNTEVNITVVFYGTHAKMYVNGALVGEGTVPTVLTSTSTFHLGTNYWDNVAGMDVDNIYFYNRALTSVQVAALVAASETDVERAYAKSIADSLYITMRGRQAGTIDGETAVRFVANLDQDAINGNEAVTKLGWAAEDGTAVTENATGYMLNTVTSDSNLAAAGKYAYTYVQATENSVAVLPCVQITVNGNDYWFAYDGISGNATSTDKSAVVSAIDVEGIFTAAAENTLA